MPTLSRSRQDRLDFSFHDLEHTSDGLRSAVLEGLARPAKAIPSKFLYDDRGSRLFERICELPEYYLTRTEIGLLEHACPEIAATVGPDATIVEFGSGSAVKTRILLDAVGPRAFVPIDISRGHLIDASRALAADYPSTRLIAICADFSQHVELPACVSREQRVAFFPGSTIGNFTREAAVAFMARARHLVGRGGRFLVGVDLKKDVDTLWAAYNDTEGVTAAFNLNLLERINRELGGDFDSSAFRHDAPWRAGAGRIEMHLVSTRAQSVSIDGASFSFREGESIHTENSHKYEVGEFQALARSAGFDSERHWVDEDRLFSLHLLRA